MKKLNFFTCNMNKRCIEILRDLEINEKYLMMHIEKYLLKKYKELYSYRELIKYILKLKNNYINNEGLFNKKII